MKALRVLSILLLTIASHRAYAWGDDGHKAIALIAQNYLEPAVKTKIDAMLKADRDNLTPHDLSSEATRADKYRDSNNRRDHYQQTQNFRGVTLAPVSHSSHAARNISNDSQRLLCAPRSP
jgi:hypothetical protein